MITLLLFACGPDVSAIHDPARPEHFFDVPFPSDADHLGADGLPDLTGWPLATPELTSSVEQGWADRIGMTAHGFANNGSAYFRFTGALDLPEQTSGDPEDPVLLVALDGSELLPLEVRFVADPEGDAHWGPNTLALAPQLGHPPKSGQAYAAVVMKSAGVKPAPDWEPPDGLLDALDAAGVRGKPAIATVFTVQDATGQLASLFDDVDSRTIDWGAVEWKRVVSLDFAQGTTPGGEEATVSTATFGDGGTSVAYLSYDPGEVHTVDLLDWPAVVYEGRIPVLNYQDAEDRPYMTPGALHVTDTDRFSGWIEFDADGNVTSEPWVEEMRVVVSIPKGSDGQPISDAPVLIWDHGTAGQAYEIVHRASAADDNRAVAEAIAGAGWATIGHDATLYGQRYPLIDEGYGGSLGFYNIVNLPAFRDNQRQTAVDAHTLARYVRERLNDDLPAGSVDATRLRRGGHSLGSVTTNLSLAARPDEWEAAFLTGSGGLFSHYFLDTGLVATMDPATIESIFPLFGVEPPDEITTQSVAGAVLGLEEPAWEHVDRLHPFLTLFQWTMDPSDPMAIARDEALPTVVFIAPGDYQTPDFTAEALAEAQPSASVVYCEARGDYDPHQCFWREPEGPTALGAWLAE